ncbi:MAG: glycosyltransferase family 2 protein, partial [Oscillospiraceae bacterium]|nr:glycosyltransferase family 2 protein [Oscillospiraceae bacterium]
MNKKLSVCIPTYNRSKLLKLTLDSVLAQINDEVELIVCDNASSDNTQELMNEYVSKYNISYYRSDKNRGMDYNFLQCLKNATGEYIQLLSDDDVLLPGAIEKLLNLISKYKPIYINLNSYTYNG